MDKPSHSDFSFNRGVVTKGKTNLSRYFHPYNSERNQRFLFIYKLFSITDTSLGREVGVSRSTMNRYRRGIFEPCNQMKLIIAKAVSKMGNYPVDTCILFGDDLFFNNFKKSKEIEK